MNEQVEMIAMPSRGGDAIFQLSRSWWVKAEREGLIALLRLKRPGNGRGRVMIPVNAARQLIASLSAASTARVAPISPRPAVEFDGCKYTTPGNLKQAILRKFNGDEGLANAAFAPYRDSFAAKTGVSR